MVGSLLSQKRSSVSFERKFVLQLFLPVTWSDGEAN